MNSYASKIAQALFFSSLLLPTLAYWEEVANPSGTTVWFGRLNYRYNAGRGEGRGPFDQIGECYPSPWGSQREPLAGAVVWNRPNEVATLALAFYANPTCGAELKTASKRAPLAVMVLDKSLLRGLHAANFKALETGTVHPRIGEVRTRALRAIKVEDEVKRGGILHGIPVQDLPGSLVFWDTSGRRHVKKQGVRWMNGISYEKLESAMSINLLLREVIERFVNLPKPLTPKDIQNVMEIEKYLNEQVGVPGDKLVAPPRNRSVDYTLPIDDSYGPGSEQILRDDPGRVHGIIMSNTIANINAASEESEDIRNQINSAIGRPGPQNRDINPVESNDRPQQPENLADQVPSEVLVNQVQPNNPNGQVQPDNSIDTVLPENPPNQAYTVWTDAVRIPDSLRQALKVIEQELQDPNDPPPIAENHQKFKDIENSFNKTPDSQKADLMKYYERMQRAKIARILLARELYTRWRETIRGEKPGAYGPLPPWGKLDTEDLAPGLEGSFLKASDKDMWLKYRETVERYDMRFFQFARRLYENWLANNPNVPQMQIIDGQFIPYKAVSSESERSVSNLNRSPISEEIAPNANPRIRPPPISTGRQPQNIQQILEKNIPNILRQSLPPDVAEDLQRKIAESLRQTLGSEQSTSADNSEISNARPVLPITPPQLTSNPQLEPQKQNTLPQARENPSTQSKGPAPKPSAGDKTKSNNNAKPNGKNPPGRPRKLLNPIPEGIDIYAAPESEESPEIVRPVFRLSELGITQKKAPQEAQQANFEPIPLSFSQNIPQNRVQGFPQNFPQSFPQSIPQGYPQYFPQNEPQNNPQLDQETREQPGPFQIRLIREPDGEAAIDRGPSGNTVQNIQGNNALNQVPPEQNPVQPQQNRPDPFHSIFTSPHVTHGNPLSNTDPRFEMWNSMPAMTNFDPRMMEAIRQDPTRFARLLNPGQSPITPMESYSRMQYSDGSRMGAPSTVTTQSIEIEQQPEPLLAGRPVSEVLNQRMEQAQEQRQDPRFPAVRQGGRPPYSQDAEVRRSRQVLETVRDNNIGSDESLEPGPNSRLRTEGNQNGDIYVGNQPPTQPLYPNLQNPGNGRRVQVNNFAINVIPTRPQGQPGDRST
ncbi:hypothetical protein AA313_de0205505 [Arthrobotrys entomopaga]|nr:hypothetical protein AA313_de0205505 [Arthrobotrys entomopaga]